MKKFILLALFSIVSLHVFSQETEDINVPSKAMPPAKMLPKAGKVKHIYELPSKCEYEIFNSMGEFVTKGNDQFIDYTAYKKGIYFIRYGNKTERFEKK
ncbi:MAG TPA: hypothetical protein VD905_05390 [Flavobacteriales bacterium]|nr:hypothetical protein [Flavobacteriales bacterium]